VTWRSCEVSGIEGRVAAPRAPQQAMQMKIATIAIRPE
jgi:hypothetical protein